MLQDLDLVRRRLLLAGLAFGLVTPAQARGYRLAGPDGLAQDAAQQQALLSTGALAFKTSVVALRRSPNPDVRAFAQSEIAEQRAISAAVIGSPQPVVPVGRHGAAILAEAQSLRGGLIFDRVYVGRQIEGHQRLHALRKVTPGPARIARWPASRKAPCRSSAGTLPSCRSWTGP